MKIWWPAGGGLEDLTERSFYLRKRSFRRPRASVSVPKKAGLSFEACFGMNLELNLRHLMPA